MAEEWSLRQLTIARAVRDALDASRTADIAAVNARLANWRQPPVTTLDELAFVDRLLVSYGERADRRQAEQATADAEMASYGRTAGNGTA